MVFLRISSHVTPLAPPMPPIACASILFMAAVLLMPLSPVMGFLDPPALYCHELTPLNPPEFTPVNPPEPEMYDVTFKCANIN